MKKVLGIIALSLVGLVLVFVLYINLSWDKTYDAPYPEITISTDSTIIAHGKHLVYGAAHCASCHVPSDKLADVEAGKDVLLSGGWQFHIPPGTLRALNLTPDPETGIGKLTDAEIARTMRYAVGSDGRPIFPLMPFQNMSDDDVAAIISFLRSQEPVAHKVERTEYSFLGKAILTFGLIKPEGPTGTPPVSVTKDSTVEYGKYLANSVANCAGCHTNRDLMTGAFIGPRFAGGMNMPPEEASQGYGFITPNLTPHETGVLAKWNEDAFLKRFKSGRLVATSPMPWASFSRMDDIELKAIYRYLKSLEPVENPIPKTVFAPGEAIPE